MSEGDREFTATTTQTDKADTPPKHAGSGEMLVRGLLARGRPQPGEVAKLIAQFPNDRLAIIQALHQTLGNAFVAQVLAVAPDGDADHDEDRDHDHSVFDTTLHADVAKAPQTPPTDPVAELLGKVPTQTKGADGYAAWMLKAKDLGFITAYPSTESELGDLRDNKQQVRTGEGEPRQSIEDSKREADKKSKKPKLDRVTKVGSGKTYKGYDVGVDESSILKTLVELVRGRITAWRATGATKKPIVLQLGDFVRGDAGYGGSPHTGGNAMDLSFIGANNTAGDVIDLLHDLPAGPPLVIVRDSNNALHIDRLDGRYGLGVPSMGDYLPPELDLEKTKAAAITANGNDHTQKIEATGIEWGSGWVQTYSATWQENTKEPKKSAWIWSVVRTVDLAENRIASAQLRDAIADYRKRSGTSSTTTPTKPANPHPQHKQHETEHR